jgi:hypothetical protein
LQSNGTAELQSATLGVVEWKGGVHSEFSSFVEVAKGMLVLKPTGGMPSSLNTNTLGHAILAEAKHPLFEPNGCCATA